MCRKEKRVDREKGSEGNSSEEKHMLNRSISEEQEEDEEDSAEEEYDTSEFYQTGAVHERDGTNPHKNATHQVNESKAHQVNESKAHQVNESKAQCNKQELHKRARAFPIQEESESGEKERNNFERELNGPVTPLFSLASQYRLREAEAAVSLMKLAHCFSWEKPSAEPEKSQEKEEEPIDVVA